MVQSVRGGGGGAVKRRRIHTARAVVSRACLAASIRTALAPISSRLGPHAAAVCLCVVGEGSFVKPVTIFAAVARKL